MESYQSELLPKGPRKETNRKMVTLGLLAALFIGALDVTVVSTATPHIIEELQGLAMITWVFSIYTLTTCVATPIFGKLADLYGRKSVFMIGLIVFVLASVLCGMTESMTGLIWFRALQGIGAGALTPVTFTLIGDLYPGEQRGRMQGVFASVWSVAGLLGPLVGGYFVDYLSWRWIFYINIPIGVVSLVLVFGFLHEKFERQRKKIDYAGAAAFTLGISALLYALLSGGESLPWSSPVLWTLLAVALLAFVAFIRIERRAEEPMIPLSLFRNGVMNVSNLSGFLAFSISTGTTIYAPMWLQSLLGYSATHSGLMVMSMSLSWPIAANLAGKLMFRLGAKRFVVFGSLLVLLGGIWLMALRIESPFWSMTAILTIIGFGMGCLSTPQTVLIQSVVGWQMRGTATATNSLMRSLGQTVGVAIFGVLFNSHLMDHTKAEMAAGMQSVFAAIFVIALLNLAAVFFLPSAAKIAAMQKS
ncbi:drug resistance transporter, EmrB/QacA subfamily [Paenibacillus sp. UNCCL117]|uniref:MDR family MFS transporter n=1 Tax=unclassified Paenibacillus TaxID=185978 RepID=UPI0008876146|nr:MULTISPECIES: MDR family MFS transporter [unclassified Paenibacillus]SDE14873.1 drug resistance transporter, EmrB/QacA subfamily [Paenibacillus sp. cl123]SFW60723.1 drug resistance transporter, EmrB/QacA subfamily [Paenibacillus sp. UNCCL117]